MAADLFLVALTGTVAAGKSAVAACFAAHGARVIDCDQLSRDLVRPGGAGFLAIEREFGGRYFTQTGELDRDCMRQAIFHDPAIRQRLNRVLHPLILAELKCRLLEVAADADVSPTLVVVEVPLLYEAGWQGMFDRVVAVRVNEEELIRRLMRRDLLGREAAAAALAAQWPSGDKTSRADYVIDNNGSLAALRAAVERLMPYLK